MQVDLSPSSQACSAKKNESIADLDEAVTALVFGDIHVSSCEALIRHHLTSSKLRKISPAVTLLRLEQLKNWKPNASWIAGLKHLSCYSSFIEQYRPQVTQTPPWVIPRPTSTQSNLLDVDLSIVSSQNQGALSRMFSLSNPGDKELLNSAVRIALNSLADKEPQLASEFGPLNAYEGRVCFQSRGCRMFTCLCREEEHSDDPFSWFEAVCCECGVKISKYWHALRYPMAEGGWFGCYHTWDCMPRFYDDLELARIEQARATIEAVGIFDREDAIAEPVVQTQKRNSARKPGQKGRKNTKLRWRPKA